MLFPLPFQDPDLHCFSATSMRPSHSEYPTPGRVNFQSTPGQFCTSDNQPSLHEFARFYLIWISGGDVNFTL